MHATTQHAVHIEVIDPSRSTAFSRTQIVGLIALMVVSLSLLIAGNTGLRVLGLLALAGAAATVIRTLVHARRGGGA